MSTASSSDGIREHILDLTWSLWAELGVSSWTRRHQQWAIDPEPLILFTAHISESDRRLRDEALDWCIGYGTYVSTTRLRNLVKHAPPERQTAFARFAATVNAHSDHRWPSSAQPINYKPTGRSSLASFTAPALIALRLRALVGVAARTEILRVIVGNPDRPFTASDLVCDVNYTKRNIDNALDSLRIAGLLEVRQLRNQHQYRLTEPGRLLAFVGDRPSLNPRWTPIFVSIACMLYLADRAGELAKQVAMVEATRVFRQISGLIDDANLVKPAKPIVGPDALDAFFIWAEELTGRLAAGDGAAFQQFTTHSNVEASRGE
jgi:DNA-binding transcriptional ArsR family regulator